MPLPKKCFLDDRRISAMEELPLSSGRLDLVQDLEQNPYMPIIGKKRPSQTRFSGSRIQQVNRSVIYPLRMKLGSSDVSARMVQ